MGFSAGDGGPGRINVALDWRSMPFVDRGSPAHMLADVLALLAGDTRVLREREEVQARAVAELERMVTRRLPDLTVHRLGSLLRYAGHHTGLRELLDLDWYALPSAPTLMPRKHLHKWRCAREES